MSELPSLPLPKKFKPFVGLVAVFKTLLAALDLDILGINYRRRHNLNLAGSISLFNRFGFFIGAG